MTEIETDHEHQPQVLFSATEPAAQRYLAWKNIVVKAWSDPNFKAELERDPCRVLRENGYPVEDGKTYKVIAEQSNEVTLIIPVQPSPIPKVLHLSDLDPGF